jgi:DNA-binding MarR family transcriptional regulator
MAGMGDEVARRAAASNALEHEFGVIIRRIRRTTATRAHMVHPGLPAASYSMLTALRDSGPHRSSDLAEIFAIDKGAVSRQIARLDRLGLVERLPDPDDGRAQRVALTATGAERLKKVDLARREWYAERLADWSADDIAELAALLARYNSALD